MANLSVFDMFNDEPFGRVFQGMFRPLRSDGEVAVPTIRMDVEESDKAYTIKAEVPGVKKEDISVQVNGDLVSIQAEVRKDTEARENGDRIVRSERAYGMASRSFRLPVEVDGTATDAVYENGVLRLTLPKKGSPEAKQVTVR